MNPQDSDHQVDGLLNLARNRSSLARETRLAIAQDLFGGRESILSQADRILMLNLMRSLVDRVEAMVKTELGNYLGSLPGGPRSLLAYLAGVKHSVAWPILVESRVLGDPDLVEVIYYKALQHQLVLARRDGSSPDVDGVIEAAGAFVSKGESGPAATAYFFRPADSAGVPESPAIEPAELTSDLIRRLCLWCSVALRQHLLEQMRIDEILLDDALEYAVDRSAQALGGRPPSPQSPSPERTATPANPASLLSLLESGAIAEFEAAFAELSALRPALLRRMIYEPGGEGLATICVATEIARRTFAAIFLLTRDGEAAGVQEVAGALALYDRLSPIAARRVMARWRRDADYLNAIREIGGGA